MTPLPPTTPPPAGTPSDTHRTDLAKCRMGICMTSVELDGVPADFARTLERELAAALKERDEARAKQLINTHIRLWDLVRYARAELHEDDLITDQEYADLCMGTKADQKLPGSPSPRRLEDYDDMRKELAALRQQLAGAEEAKGEVLALVQKNHKTGLECDSIVASCGCMTKTNEVRFHKPGCKYRLICERDEARARLEEAKKGFAVIARLADGTEVGERAYNAYLAIVHADHPTIEELNADHAEIDASQRKEAGADRMLSAHHAMEDNRQQSAPAPKDDAP